MAKAKSYKQIAIDYAREVTQGKKKRVGKEVMLACMRFLADLEREELELRTKETSYLPRRVWCQISV